MIKAEKRTFNYDSIKCNVNAVYFYYPLPKEVNSAYIIILFTNKNEIAFTVYDMLYIIITAGLSRNIGSDVLDYNSSHSLLG